MGQVPFLPFVTKCVRAYAASRADTIRKRLGWVAGIAHGQGGKPKGMRDAGAETLVK